MSEVLVKVENVSKKFSKDFKKSLWYGVSDMSSALFSNQNNQNVLRPSEFWAVKDVSFELRRGECLGLIGHNGAGKSTLLKILNGLIRPDEGKITMNGRIGALIELGAGFNPILTGRENIYNNGAVLGFSKKEIDEKLEAIIEFSEIGEFIDSPVRNYSSGMNVRLGFAVAAQMEPDVLIIDEVLAVGDLGFRIKCLNRISELLSTVAVIFVSHSMPQIARISTSGVLLSKGKTSLYTSDIAKLINSYYSIFQSGDNESQISKEFSLTQVEINDNKVVSGEVISIKYLNDFSFKFFGSSKLKSIKVSLRIVFMDIEQKICAEAIKEDIEITNLETSIVELKLHRLPLSNNRYAVNFEIYESRNGLKGKIYRYEKNYVFVTVEGVQPTIAPIKFETL